MKEKSEYPEKRKLLFGNIGSGHHQTSVDERKNKKEYLRRTRTLLETKLYRRNLIEEINTWAIPLVKYSGREKNFNKWTREQENSWRCIKPYTPEMISTDYVARKEGRRGLAIIEDSVDKSIRRLEDYIKKSKERLITETRNNINSTGINRTITWKQKKNNCMDITSDKQAKSLTRKFRYG